MALPHAEGEEAALRRAVRALVAQEQVVALLVEELHLQPEVQQRGRTVAMEKQDGAARVIARQEARGEQLSVVAHDVQRLRLLQPEPLRAEEKRIRPFCKRAAADIILRQRLRRQAALDAGKLKAGEACGQKQNKNGE